MKAIIFRTNHNFCNSDSSLQGYIDKGLKVDTLSEDKLLATKEITTLQDLIEISQQTERQLVIGTEELYGCDISVEIYDDYRE